MGGLKLKFDSLAKILGLYPPFGLFSVFSLVEFKDFLLETVTTLVETEVVNLLFFLIINALTKLWDLLILPCSKAV